MQSRGNRNLLFFCLFVLFVIIFTVAPGKVIMGLDNASPYWGLTSIFDELKRGYNFFYTGPLLFAFPLNLLSLLGINASVISHLFVYFTITSGLFGIFTLNEKHIKSDFAAILSILFSGATLLTIWLLANPSVLFLCAFSSIPWIIVLITNKESSTITKKIFIGFALLNFATTIVNPIAFTLFVIQIFAIAFALNYDHFDFKKSTVRLSIIVIATIAAMQLCLFGTKGAVFIGTELQAYAQEQMDSPINTGITDSLRRAEVKNNNISNMLRYATGWLQLSLPDDTPVFSDAVLLRENVILITLQLVPYILLTLAITSTQKYKQKWVSTMLILLAVGYLLPSSYLAPIIKSLPFHDAFRWLSSKLWPMTLILTTSLAVSILPEWINSHKTQIGKFSLKLLVIVGFLPFLLPFASKSVIPTQTRVEIPQEYFDSLKPLAPSDQVLVLTTPQSVYFRQYNWGYYGTDFLMYITRAEIIDNATNNTKKITKYNSLRSALKNGDCKPNTYLLIDNPTDLDFGLPASANLKRSTAAFDLYQCSPNTNE